MQVQFFFLAKNVTLKHRNDLKKYIPTIFKENRKELGQLNYIFCSDQYLLEINKKHLKHNYYTDIITFDFTEHCEPVIGEIYISIDRVRENSKEQNTSLTEELHRVIFHGALHLCGFKDKKPLEIREMRAAEETLLFKYFNK